MDATIAFTVAILVVELAILIVIMIVYHLQPLRPPRALLIVILTFFRCLYTVQLRTGSTCYITASKSLKISAIVKELCLIRKDFAYLWIGTLNTEFVQSAVSASSTSKSLEIGANTLLPGKK